jgi:hypothetical protein
MLDVSAQATSAPGLDAGPRSGAETLAGRHGGLVPETPVRDV